MEFLKVWTSFRQAISPLTDSEKGRLFDAMLLYAETGEEPEGFLGNERFLWIVAKQDIDRTAQKCEVLRQNGFKGGRPKTKQNQTEADESKQNQTEANETKDNQTEPYKVKKSNVKKSNVNEGDRRFTPPTLEEVRAYCQERKNGIDPEYFIAYNENRNWTLSNGKKMKDWRLAVVTWEKHNFSKETPKKAPAQQYQQREYDGEESMDDVLGRITGRVGA